MKFCDIDYEIVRSSRKTLAVEVRPGGAVVVRSPKRLKDDVITEFIKNRYNWICKAVERQKQRQDKLSLSKEELIALRKRAAEILPERVEYYSSLMRLYPSAVKINFARTRFGSCSAKNSINFSAFLMLYPPEAVDYVVVHELAHIKYKNHQKEFYSLIEKYMPDYKKRAALLKGVN